MTMAVVTWLQRCSKKSSSIFAIGRQFVIVCSNLTLHIGGEVCCLQLPYLYLDVYARIWPRFIGSWSGG